MAKLTFHQPDEEKMKQALKRYNFEPVGVILHLAWLEGMTRKEIHDLTWSDVDFDAATLRLPDREVPLEADTAELLRGWKARCERFSAHVAVSDRLRKPLAVESMSGMARMALDEAGMPEVSLRDLRCDYIRRQFASSEWPTALRVSGLSLTTYRNGIDWLEGITPKDVPMWRDDSEQEFKLWRVLQTERATPAGIALWLGSRLGLRSAEIVALTWDMVDFEAGVLRLPGREVALTVSVRSVLTEERSRRAPGEDAHVLLTEHSRKPMDIARLGNLTRAALLRGGIEDKTLADLRLDEAGDAEREALLAWVREHGSISRAEAAKLLGVSDGQAYRRLLALAEAGKLVRVSLKYYPAGTASRPEEQRELICRWIGEQGPISRREAAELLHIGERTAGRVLKRMVAAGELCYLRTGRKYTLPEA